MYIHICKCNNTYPEIYVYIYIYIYIYIYVCIYTYTYRPSQTASLTDVMKSLSFSDRFDCSKENMFFFSEI